MRAAGFLVLLATVVPGCTLLGDFGRERPEGLGETSDAGPDSEASDVSVTDAQTLDGSETDIEILDGAVPNDALPDGQRSDSAPPPRDFGPLVDGEIPLQPDVGPECLNDGDCAGDRCLEGVCVSCDPLLCADGARDCEISVGCGCGSYDDFSQALQGDGNATSIAACPGDYAAFQFADRDLAFSVKTDGVVTIDAGGGPSAVGLTRANATFDSYVFTGASVSAVAVRDESSVVISAGGIRNSTGSGEPGGCLKVVDSAATLSSVAFFRCRSGDTDEDETLAGGAAIHVLNGELTMTSGSVRGSTTGLLAENSTVALSATRFEQNVARYALDVTGVGQMIRAINSQVTLRRVVVTDNLVVAGGGFIGAIVKFVNSRVRIVEGDYSDNTFEGASVGNRGAIIKASTDNIAPNFLNIRRATFEDNRVNPGLPGGTVIWDAGVITTSTGPREGVVLDGAALQFDRNDFDSVVYSGENFPVQPIFFCLQGECVPRRCQSECPLGATCVDNADCGGANLCSATYCDVPE